jgi:hypothetical protein
MSWLARTAWRRLVTAGMLAGLFGNGALLLPVLAQDGAKSNASVPDFSSNNTGWVSIGTDWVAVPGSPAPVTDDPAHPYVPNNTGRQPTFRVANVDNPNLTQFAKDELKKSNDEVLRGKAMYARESRCWATGVPTYLLNPAQPTFFLQAPDKVTMIWQMDHQVRRIYMNAPHSENPKPSWYGESVGHYEGDTLVVDTVGQNTKTFVDNYRTPHSEMLHVVERYRLVDDGKMLQADVTIEDPAVFIKPLKVMHRWRRAQGPMIESSCAEGELGNPFQQDVEPLPAADKPDF